MCLGVHSEKADCTTAKSLLAEGADINRSLVALGNVISALGKPILCKKKIVSLLPNDLFRTPSECSFYTHFLSLQ